MSKEDFIIKIIINAICFLLIITYIIIRNLRKKDFVYSIINKEKELVLMKKLKLDILQNNSWAKNLDEITSFSSISVAIVLIVVAYLVEKDLPYFKDLYFKIILFIISIGAVSYTLSIQLYNNAISKMPLINWTLKQRKIGATFQVIGWYALIASIMLCIMLVDTYLGTICNLYTVISVIIIYEIKVAEEK